MTKPNFASSHDWHVQLCCQRSQLHPHWAGSFGSRTKTSSAGRVLELDGAVCCRCFQWAGTASCSSLKYRLRTGRSRASGVLRELFKIIEVRRLCQPFASTFFVRSGLIPQKNDLSPWPKLPCCPIPQRSNVKTSKRRHAARGT